MADQAMSLPDIIAADVPTFLAESDRTGKANAEVANKAAGILRSSASIYDELAVQDVVINQAKNAAVLKAQKETIQSAKAAGVDGSESDRLVQLIQESNAATDEVAKNLIDYRKKNETSIWEEPLEWVKAQFLLPDSQARLEGAVKTAEFIDARIAQVNNQIQGTARTRLATQEAVTTASAAAEARKTALVAQLEANRVALDALKYDSAAINAIHEASKDRLGILFQARSAQQAEKQFDLALANFALDKQRFDFTKQMRQDELDAKRQGKRIDEVSLSYINASRRSLGLPDMTSDEFAAGVKLGLPDLKYHYENGTRVLATGVPMVGTSPADTIEVLSSIPTNLPDVRGDTARTIAQIAKEYLDNTSEGKMIDRKDKEKVKDFVNKSVKLQLSNDYAEVKQGSVFDVGDLSSYLELSAVKNLPITQKLLAPAAQAKQPLNDAKMIMNLVVSGVRNGTITTSEAQDIATIYQGATLLNQAARGFKGFGIQLPNDGRNHYVSLSSSLIGSKSRVDLSNPTDVGRWLNSELARQQYKDQFRYDKDKAKVLLPGLN